MTRTRPWLLGEMFEIAWRAVALLGLGAGLGFGVNAARTDGVALSGFAPPVTCSVAEDGALGEAPRVELVSQAEAASLCADPSTRVADARSAQAYAEGHVAGAIHLPCSASEQAAATAISGFSARKLLLVYGERTDDAFAVAEELHKRLGPAAPRIGVLEGGFAAWRAAGQACASGTCAECDAAPGGHDESSQHGSAP